MKYFIPEWNDRVDPGYDFINEAHSPEHKLDPFNNDAYIWDIFGVDKVPIDGVLVSRITLEQDKKKYQLAKQEGIHKVLRLPQNFEIMGDCGAFGYVDEENPRYDPIQTLKYYQELGFNYGVTVDHLVVPKHKRQKDYRMKITFENALKSFEEWKKRYKNDFQLIMAVQGWNVSDYLNFYRKYVDLGASHIGFGGLARSPTSFIIKLIEELKREIEESRRSPEYIHFFGLARFALFSKFRELEDLGVRVGFDSASYLRKAWLSAPTSQLNYLSIDGKGYTAIRIPFIGKKREKVKESLVPEQNENFLKNLEQKCLKELRLYDKGETEINQVLSTILQFYRAAGEKTELISYYRKTLEDKPWKRCSCPICSNIGIEVVIFRGNNRNRRRGFHNTYIFYQVLKDPQKWPVFINQTNKDTEFQLSSLKKGEKVLIITECSKEKLGYNSSVKAPAKKMYQGRLFKTVREYAETMDFDYVIISAKYGLVFPEEIIEGYEKVIQTKEDVEDIRSIVEKKLKPILQNYEKIVIIAGEKYREILRNLWDERFISVKSRGYGELCHIIRDAIPKERSLLEFT
ncbi:MAG: tRNA-guanine transglycosylase DpdA [Nitrososphaeria archaeon]